ncbi:MAG: efflux RND transporter periplasmic adaptor subunit [Sphaerochaetaceae bacterium]|nr:efflux RND transporter periplasmic adaptor subunit [Sphaerochaetaceae bacterium]
MSNENKKLSFDKIVTLILVLVILVLAFLVGRNLLGNSEPNKKMNMRQGGNVKASEISVMVQTMEKETFTQITTIGAEITNTLDNYGLTSDVGGKVTKLFVEKNQSVEKGDVIAYVDPSVAGAEYKAQPVISSLSGVIEELDVYVGQTITTSTSIAKVGSVGELEITAKLPERYLSTIEEGMKATFTTAAWPEEEMNATVKTISSTVNSSNRTFTVTLSVEEDERLKAGMYVTLNLTTDIEEDVLMIPTTAISTYLNEPCVYVEENGKAVRRIVTTGKREKGRSVITSGLNVGDRVIVKGTVTEGSALKVVE